MLDDASFKKHESQNTTHKLFNISRTFPRNDISNLMIKRPSELHSTLKYLSISDVEFNGLTNTITTANHFTAMC